MPCFKRAKQLNEYNMEEEKVVQVGDGEDEQWVQTHADMKIEDKIKDLSITCKPVSLF